MKLLLICHEHPPIGGGGSIAASQLAEHMARGHEVDFISMGWGPLPVREKIGGYCIHRIGVGRRSSHGSTVWEWLKFMLVGSLWSVKWAWKNRPDRTLAFFGIPGGWIALVLYLVYRIPYVVSLRAQDVPGFCPAEYRYHHLLARPLIRLVWRYAEEIVAESEDQRRLALREKAGDIAYIPNGVDYQHYAPKDDYKVPNGRAIRLLYAGRFTVQKNLPWLLGNLEAMADSLKFGLTFIGNGPETQRLVELMAVPAWRDRAVIIDWCTRAELRCHLAAADIFILPSLAEGSPNTINEVMAAGVPILATAAEGTRELISSGKNGVLVPLGDDAVFRRELLELAGSDILRERLGRAARATAEGKGWDRIAERYLELMGCHSSPVELPALH